MSAPPRTWAVLALALPLLAGAPAARSAPPPPTPVTPPTITGTARVGEELRASRGTWTNEPTAYSFQWRRCEGAGACVDVAGAKAEAYRLVTADVGKTIRVKVKATNAGGPGWMSSDPTAPVQPAGTQPPPPPPPPPAGLWSPAPGTTWQWQLQGTIDLSVDVPVYDVDLFDTSAATVAELHARGRRVICYLSAGSWEDWRPDASRFPAAVKGRSNGWPGERWLDVRRLDVLGPIMEARLDLCRSKGFDAVEPDNIDGYTNQTGFPLTAADQLRYNRFLADAAHARGLSIGLKNDLEQVRDLVATFDWALNESCYQWNECALLMPFVHAGKAVLHVEYGSSSAFCADARARGFSSMRKRQSLDAWRAPCP
jgi:hypothetical protein